MLEKVNFQFYNSVAPRYIEPLFLKIQSDELYSSLALVEILQQEMTVDGKDIVANNMKAWSEIGLGTITIDKSNRGARTIFQISSLGKYMQEIYSTNNDLFYDLMHYFFYSTYIRSKDIRKVRYWVYSQICNELWNTAPSKLDSFTLASKIQTIASEEFTNYYPAITKRSTGSGSTWLQKLSPPFLENADAKELTSKRRDQCTSQLFHLAVDLLYTIRNITYGTSITVDSEIVNDICCICLLDPNKFWEIAGRTQMMVRGFEVRNSQWGPTVMINQPPNWIALPDLRNQEQNEEE